MLLHGAGLPGPSWREPAGFRGCQTFYCAGFSVYFRAGSYPGGDEIMIEKTLSFGYRSAKKVVIAVVGSTLLLLGIAFLVLPGPGLLGIPLGLAVLAIEFLWARDLLHKVRRGISEVSRRRRMGRQRG